MKFYNVLFHYVIEQSLPELFCSKFGDLVPKYVNLVLYNRDELMVTFKREDKTFDGLSKVFRKLNCTRGGFFLF